MEELGVVFEGSDDVLEVPDGSLAVIHSKPRRSFYIPSRVKSESPNTVLTERACPQTRVVASGLGAQAVIMRILSGPVEPAF